MKVRILLTQFVPQLKWEGIYLELTANNIVEALLHTSP